VLNAVLTKEKLDRVCDTLEYSAHNITATASKFLVVPYKVMELKKVVVKQEQSFVPGFCGQCLFYIRAVGSDKH
jgi:hypothetical protein